MSDLNDPKSELLEKAAEIAMEGWHSVQDARSFACAVSDYLSTPPAVVPAVPSDAIAIIDQWMHVPTMKLRAGEMTAQEVRSVIGVLGAVKAEINRATPPAATPAAPSEVTGLRTPVQLYELAKAHGAYTTAANLGASITFRLHELVTFAAALAQPAPVAAPADPMDWPLPCDVTVGHGTMRKGVALRTLVSRMKALYEMATGNNADAVAAPAEPAFITAMIDARRESYALDQSCPPEFLQWLDTTAPREGVAANEAWNAGVEWQKTQAALPIGWSLSSVDGRYVLKNRAKGAGVFNPEDSSVRVAVAAAFFHDLLASTDTPAPSSGYVCADCKTPLRAGYTCDVCGSDAAEDAPASEAVADLRDALAFMDQMREAAQSGEEVTATGVARDAREWLERAARAVTAPPQAAPASEAVAYIDPLANEAVTASRRETWPARNQVRFWQPAYAASTGAESALRSALERLEHSYRLLLARKPVRDVEETLAEVAAALQTAPPQAGAGKDGAQ